MAIRMGGLLVSEARTSASWWRVTQLRLVPNQVMPVPPVMDDLTLLVSLVTMEKARAAGAESALDCLQAGPPS